MKNLIRFTAILGILVVVMGVGFGVAAQDVPGPGEGGIIIQGNSRGSANFETFTQIRCSGVDCRESGDLMFPQLLEVSPFSVTTVGAATEDLGQLALDWTVSEDGKVYTFNLRQDAFWSDGEQITAKDVYFTWLAIEAGDEILMSSSFGPAQRDIASMEIIDDFTIAVTVESPTCTVLDNLGIYVDPAHVYGWTPEVGEDFDWQVYVDSPANLTPEVTAGPFKYFNAEPGTAIYLAANPDYYAPSVEGGVIPEGWVFLDVPDDTILTERFLSFQAGEPNYVHEPPASQFATLSNSEAQYAQAPGNIWHYMALNLADPTNPQNGWDADGNHVDQGIHPLFGDKSVRQALQYAMNIDEIIQGAQNGSAGAMTAYAIPSAFTLHPTLERRPYDPELAASMLADAGWTDGDGDGIIECNGCSTAEDGTPFSFTLLNPTVGGREDVAILVQAQFAQIGIEVEVQSLDFNGMYDALEAQTFDAAIAGWSGGVPYDPDVRWNMGADADIVSTAGAGGGFNFGSYYNPEIEQLSVDVNDVALHGCDEQSRKEIGWRIQEILWDEQPYLWLYSLDNAYAAAPNVGNFDPQFPAFGQWNIDAWYVQQ